MRRYETAFASLKEKNEAAFIPFAVAGDPDIDKSEQIFKAYIDGGADILEIGYPFSDPVADGPVNQRAGQRAIESGLNHQSFFSLIKKLRTYTDIPFGVLLYANSVSHLGFEAFCKKATAAGIDSLLVADMPPEESIEMQKAMKRYNLGRVYIVSELTPPERMKFICNQIDSFVYVVSRLGATGTDKKLSGSVSETLRTLKQITDKPLAVGFGISTPEHIKAVHKAGADGVIVGSALVTTIEENLSTPEKIPSVMQQRVSLFKNATRCRGKIQVHHSGKQ